MVTSCGCSTLPPLHSSSTLSQPSLPLSSLPHADSSPALAPHTAPYHVMFPRQPIQGPRAPGESVPGIKRLQLPPPYPEVPLAPSAPDLLSLHPASCHHSPPLSSPLPLTWVSSEALKGQQQFLTTLSTSKISATASGGHLPCPSNPSAPRGQATHTAWLTRHHVLGSTCPHSTRDAMPLLHPAPRDQVCRWARFQYVLGP